MGSPAPEAPAFRFRVKRVAVIGAGPCGLAAVKYLLGQNAFEHITVFEQQAEVGGVWYYDDRVPETVHVPQVDPSVSPDPPVRTDPGEPPLFPTPMYSALHTNVPRELMGFTDVPIPADTTKIYPVGAAIQEYLVDYAREARHLIRFSTQVTDVRLQQPTGGGGNNDDDDGDDDGDDGNVTVITDQWVVESLDLTTGEPSRATFDAVVVATGHYSTYYIPDIAGIAAFHAAHPGVISHSRSFRDAAAAFAGKKLVVVGNGHSGLDVAAQAGRVSRGRVLLSARTPTAPDWLAWAGAEEVAEIDEFLAGDERAVRFRGGRVERGVDAVLFATGYMYSFPFMQQQASPQWAAASPPLVTEGGRRVRGLYRHMIHIEHPTLAFLGVPRRTVPIAVGQSQAAVLAHAWANALPLPRRGEMRRWEREEEERARCEGRKSFHDWQPGTDGTFINDVYGTIERLGPPRGKEPPRWGKRRLWERSLGIAPRLEFEKGGLQARTLEELGFVFPPDKDTDHRPGEREDIGEQSALDIDLRI